MEVDEDSDCPEGARWARDDDVVWCDSAEQFVEAVRGGHTKVEVGAAAPGPLLEVVVQAAPALQCLSLTGCQLDASALSRLGAALAPSQQLKGIGVSNNPGIDGASWAAFWAGLPLTVTRFDFGDNGLTDDLLPHLVRSLSRMRTEELFLDGNEFSDLRPLLPLVSESSGLHELDVGDNSVGDAQLAALAEALPGSAVETLVLGTNPITDASAVLLVQALPRTRVATLHLDSTGITDLTLQALVAVLGGTQLVELHIDGTQVRDDGVLGLVRALPSSRITVLDAGDNNLSEATISAIEAALPSDCVE